jgi:uncharacterized membrane protein YcaP (DUF421 family)/predicted RNA-binding Zn-ribbon protein involved in translation (DUF1610 family)
MAEEITAFDLHRMFVGDASLWFLLEVAFRTCFMFVYTLVLVRATGKRGLGDLSPFELLLVVALGSAVGDPMFYADVPLFHAMVVISVIILLQRVTAVLVDRSKRVEGFIESTTTCLVVDGVIDLESLRAERFSRDELFMLLREEGIEQLGQVKRAYLEPSGRISAWLFRGDDVGPGLTLFPAEDPDYPEVLKCGVRAPESALLACLACGHILDVDSGFPLGTCPNCGRDEGWAAASMELGSDDTSNPSGGRRRRHHLLGG